MALWVSVVMPIFGVVGPAEANLLFKGISLKMVVISGDNLPNASSEISKPLDS